MFYPASLQYQINLGRGCFCVISLTTVYYLCSQSFCQPPEFLCYYKYTKNLFWFQNTIDCCRFDCVVSINSIRKAWYGDDDRFCPSVSALVKWANKKEHGGLFKNLICYFCNLNIIDMDMSAFSSLFFSNSLSCLLWEDHINMFN